MDGHRFDDVARSLTRGTMSRRVLVTALTATMGGLNQDVPAGAGKRCKASRSGHPKKCKKRHAGKRCRPPEPSRLAKCDQDLQCCGGLVCEERACKAGCRINGAFRAPGDANPANPCQSCQPPTSTTTWTDRACGDCQRCDPASGACTSDPAQVLTACGKPGADGFRPGLCFGADCRSPCGDECAGYCYLHQQDNGEPNPTRPFCCPPDARGPDGACCWINEKPGIFVDGECLPPAQVCANGAACPRECCSGICPSSTQFCVNGTIKDADFACTTDGDCVNAGYGSGTLCAGLHYSRNQNGELITMTDSGFCCPAGNTSGSHRDSNGGLVYTCCSPGELYSGLAHGCCPSSQINCPNCVCSFRHISRCC
jgi:hypothetical protein